MWRVYEIYYFMEKDPERGRIYIWMTQWAYKRWEVASRKPALPLSKLQILRTFWRTELGNFRMEDFLLWYQVSQWWYLALGMKDVALGKEAIVIWSKCDLGHAVSPFKASVSHLKMGPYLLWAQPWGIFSYSHPLGDLSQCHGSTCIHTPLIQKFRSPAWTPNLIST